MALLVGGALFARHRVKFLLGAVLGFCLVTFAWYVAIVAGWLPRPSGSSRIGYACGIVAFGIILFEMLLWPRKAFRGYRILRLTGSTRLWMFLHIWLGLLSVPLVFGHSGFIYGRLLADSGADMAGSLSMALMSLYIVVIASGVFGLLMQQVIPQKLLDDIPAETIATERERVASQLLEEARAVIARVRLRHEAVDDDHASVIVRTRVAPYRLNQLDAFFEQHIGPYIAGGESACRPLASEARAQQLFADLRRDAGNELFEAVNRLESMCATRRQLDRQYNLYWWLHSWLCVHVPLSFALFILLLVHIGYALKYW